MMFENIEEQVGAGVEWLRRFVVALGALIIAIGVVVAIIGLMRHAMSERKSFTSIAPPWERIGKVAAMPSSELC